MKSRPETSKGEKTRGRIILSAIKLAARHGFAEASFQMIADDIGLSQSAVMYHFPDKNSLFADMVREIIGHNHETVAALMRPEDGAGRRLLKHCLGNVLWALRARRQDAQVLILLYYLAGRGKDFSKIFTGMIDKGRERLVEHLLAGVREKAFTLNGEPAAVAETLQDTLFGAMLYAASAPEGAVTVPSLETKWKNYLHTLTGWTDSSGDSLLPPPGK